MKKLSLLIFSLTALVTTGQEMEGFQDIRFDFKAGVNYATVAGDIFMVIFLPGILYPLF